MVLSLIIIESRASWLMSQLKYAHAFREINFFKKHERDARASWGKMGKEKHREFHNDLNKHLRDVKNANGDSMEPKRGNSGRKIQRNFGTDEIIDALKDFYKKTGDKYKDVKRQFNKELKKYKNENK